MSSAQPFASSTEKMASSSFHTPILQKESRIGDEEKGDEEQYGEKRNDAGFVLIPQPSCEADDPLVRVFIIYSLNLEVIEELTLSAQNWPMAKKVRILAVLCLAAFSGTLGTMTGQLAYPTQAKVYHQSSQALSYTVSLSFGCAAIDESWLGMLGMLFTWVHHDHIVYSLLFRFLLQLPVSQEALSSSCLWRKSLAGVR